MPLAKNLSSYVNFLSIEEFEEAIINHDLQTLNQKNYTTDQLIHMFRDGEMSGYDSFAYVCRKRDIELATYLLQNGYPINGPQGSILNPLSSAVFTGDLEFIKMVYEKNPSLLNQPDKAGYTPLHYVAAQDNEAILEFFLRARPSVLLSMFDATPFTEALIAGKLASAKRLMEFNPQAMGDFNSKVYNPLTVCVLADANELSTALLNYNATKKTPTLGLETKDIHDLTPLHHAVKRNNPELVEILINYGANVNTKDKLGNTLFHTAASIHNSSKVLQLLMKAGSDVIVKNKEGKTPVDVAHDAGQIENKNLLIQYVIDSNNANVLEKEAKGIMAKSLAEQGQQNTLDRLIAQQDLIYKKLTKLEKQVEILVNHDHEQQEKAKSTQNHSLMGLFR